MNKKVNVRIDRDIVTSLKFFSMMLALVLAILPLFVYINGKEVFHLEPKLFIRLSVLGLTSFSLISVVLYLLSRFSPIKVLKTRKMLILFTEQLTKQTNDGKLKHSVTWKYEIRNKKINIKLYSSGLVTDKRKLGGQLSEFISQNLLSYKENPQYVEFVFGEIPNRLNGREVLENDQL